MVKLRKTAQSLWLGGRVLSFLMALSGVNASFTAMVRLRELLSNCCLM